MQAALCYKRERDTFVSQTKFVGGKIVKNPSCMKGIAVFCAKDIYIKSM